MTTSRVALGLGLALTLIAVERAAAQDWRTLDVSRQLRDSSPLSVHIAFGAGKFMLAQADPSMLYQMHLRYSGAESKPMSSYDAAARSLSLGIHSQSFQIPGDNNSESQMKVDLARNVPLDLHIELGATHAVADLGGLAVRKLEFETGAADATLKFSEPNTAQISDLVLNVGAAAFQGVGLGNAHAQKITLRAGIGDWDLRFDGDWTGDMTLDAKVAMGALHIHVPNDVKVVMNARAIIGDVSDNTSASSSNDASNDDDTPDADSSDDSSDSSDSHNVAVAGSKNIDINVGSVSVHVDPGTSKTVVVDHNPVIVRTHVTQDAKVLAKTKGQKTVIQQTVVTQTKYTLHVVGSATFGSIEVDHDLSGNNR